MRLYKLYQVFPEFKTVLKNKEIENYGEKSDADQLPQKAIDLIEAIKPKNISISCFTFYNTGWLFVCKNKKRESVSMSLNYNPHAVTALDTQNLLYLLHFTSNYNEADVDEMERKTNLALFYPIWQWFLLKTIRNVFNLTEDVDVYINTINKLDQTDLRIVLPNARITVSPNLTWRYDSFNKAKLDVVSDKETAIKIKQKIEKPHIKHKLIQAAQNICLTNRPYVDAYKKFGNLSLSCPDVPQLLASAMFLDPSLNDRIRLIYTT